MNNIGLEQINSLEDLDFRKLNLGQQFLITEQRNNKGITYNLITITILSKIVFNDLYYFKESYHRVFPCSDEEENINTDDDYETHYLYDQFELYSLHDSDKFIKQHNKIKESLAKEKEEAKKYDMTSIVLDDIYYLIDDFKIKIDNIYKCSNIIIGY
jgi:hypothetical protein